MKKEKEYSELEKRMIEEIEKNNYKFNYLRYFGVKYLLQSAPFLDTANFYSTYLLKSKQLQNTLDIKNNTIVLYHGEYLKIIKNYERAKYFMSKEKKKIFKFLKIKLQEGVLVEKLTTKNKNLKINTKEGLTTIWKSFVNPTNKTEFKKGKLIN